MKKVALLLLAAPLVLGGFAEGGETRQALRDFKDLEKPVQIFRDQEFQIDLFGSYWDSARGLLDDGFGGGLGISGFLFRYFGLGFDANLRPGEGDPHSSFYGSGSLILRYPVEGGAGASFAPYAFGGGGILSNGTQVGSGHVGGGLEYRANPRIGVFGDARYIWGAASNEAVQSRVGVRIAF
jgi:hypothetical protein